MSREPILLVHAHPQGPWVVQRGDRRLAVPAVLGRVLAPWSGTSPRRADLHGALVGATGAAPQDVDGLLAVLWTRGRRRRGPWLRGVVLPPRLVARLAQPLAAATDARRLLMLVGFGVVGLAAGLSFGAAPADSPTNWAVAIPLFLASALLHELGHAAALLRRGYPPGAVGVGLMFVLPVLWCDVSAVTALPPRRRLGVDLAGPAFQFAAAGLFALVALVWPAVGRPAATAAVGAVIWSLLPFIRSDGFWAIGDLLGVGDLDRQPQSWEPRRVVVALGTYRLLHTVFLATIGIVIGGRAAALGSHVFGYGPDVRQTVAWVLGSAALILAARRLLPMKSGAPAP